MKRILWLIAGSDPDLLEQSTESDRKKHTAIGISILLTTGAGILSGGYAFATIFKDPTISCCLGIFWGAFILNMDRSIIISTRKEKKPTLGQFLTAAIRVFVAFLIAVVVAKPLELKLFEKPIFAEIGQKNIEVTIEVQKKLDQGMPEIHQLELENQKLEEQRLQKEKTRDQLCGKAIAEAEGSSGTGKPGLGPVYQQKETLCQQQEQELASFKTTAQPKIETNHERINQLKNQKDQQLQTMKTAQENADDIITQLNILDRLCHKNPAIKSASNAISWLFIVVDTAPLFVKLLSKRSPYDALLELREHQLIENAEQDIKNTREIVSRQKQLELDQHQKAIEQASTSDKMPEVMEAIADEIIKHTKQELLKLVSKYRIPRSIRTAVKRQQNAAAQNLYRDQQKQQEVKEKVNNLINYATTRLRNLFN